jgi:hypothetical protein
MNRLFDISPVGCSMSDGRTGKVLAEHPTRPGAPQGDAALLMPSSRQFTISRIMIWIAAIAVLLAMSRGLGRGSLLLYLPLSAYGLYLIYISRGHLHLAFGIGVKPRRIPDSILEKLVPRRR